MTKLEQLEQNGICKTWDEIEEMLCSDDRPIIGVVKQGGHEEVVLFFNGKVYREDKFLGGCDLVALQAK